MAKKKKKNPGKVTFHDNKVRIEFKSNTESILFEDISSLSSSKHYVWNWKWIIIGFFAMYIPLLIAKALELDGLAYLAFSLVGIGCFIGGFVMAVKKKNKWDIVIVETRGGKQVYFSVDDGNGIETVDAIENEKRKYIN